MRTDGFYSIVLKPGVSETDFVTHLRQNFSEAVFSTRITVGIGSRLLKATASHFTPHYVLHISINLMEDRDYDFEEHVPEISRLVEAFGVVTRFEGFTVAEIGSAL